MNCNTCHYELSQCLDGRLPSGRRTVVMQHVSECEECARFWDEMQAVQRLTLGLPHEAVGDDFREQLWERIRAGEGSPDAMFRDAVPVMAKVRYALTGAAAAAAMLFVGLWLRDGSGQSPGLQDPVTSMTTAQHAADRGDDAITGPAARSGATGIGSTGSRPTGRSYTEPRSEGAGHREVVVDTTHSDPAHYDPVQYGQVHYGTAGDAFDQVALIRAAQPVGTMVVAQETARQLEARYRSVARQLHLLRRDPQQVDVQIVVGRIVDDVTELRGFAEFLLEMRRHRRVQFDDPEVGSELQLAAHTFRTMRIDRSLDTVQDVVAKTVERSPRLGTISREIAVRPGDRHEDAQVLLWLNRSQPEIFRKLFISLGSGDAISPEFGMFRQNHVFYFFDACGANWVAPRSQVEMLTVRVR